MTSRGFFLLCTGLFWLTIGYYAVRCPKASTPASVAIESPRPASKKISKAELARHASPADCWMAIGRKVYELHGFIDIHPSETGAMEPFCGKDAGNAYTLIDRGKLKGQPHSVRAKEMLDEYLVGELVD